MQAITEQRKSELLDYTLRNTPIHIFNASIKSFDHKSIYYYNRNMMLSAIPDFDNSKLWFSVIMSDVFRPFAIDYIRCEELSSQISKLKRVYTLYNKYHPKRAEVIQKHNELVIEFNTLIAPQKKLIKTYRKILREN